MLDALSAILCFDHMRALTRRAGSFFVRDLVAEGRPEHAVRSYLRLCLDRGAVEIMPERVTADGRHLIAYRTISLLPPILDVRMVEVDRVRAELTRRLGSRAADRDVFAQHAALWTALRGLRVTDERELAYAASTETLAVAPSVARVWLYRLADVDYVTAHGTGRYTLRPTRNTGPAPVLVRAGHVLDLNLMRAVNVTASTKRRAA